MNVKTKGHHYFVRLIFLLLIINHSYGQPNETKTDNIYLIIASNDYINSPSLDTFINI
jgi:hypothetical protein